MRMILSAVLGLGVMMGGMAMAKPHLSEVKSINDGLLAIGLADEIRKNCNSISARMIKAIFYLNSLENKAKAMGYSDEEIKAYVKSDAEKAKMRAKGEAYLAEQGVSRDNPETFCALGRAEIAKQSLIGALLKAK